MTSQNSNPAVPVLEHPGSSDDARTLPILIRKHSKIFNPFAIALLALGMAVMFWGFGYKMSLYHRHADRMSVESVARPWIRERSSAVAGFKVRIQGGSNDGPASAAWLGFTDDRSLGSFIEAAREPSRSQTTFEFSLFSRPPPSKLSL